MKKLILLLSLSILIISTPSCKKEKSAEPASAPATVAPVTVEGAFFAQVSRFYGQPAFNNNSLATAKFWESNNTGLLIDADSVSINSAWLNVGTMGQFSRRGEWYGSPQPINPFDYVYWHSTGSTKVPVISYLTTNAIPYIDDSCIPISSISKAGGLSFSHPTLNGTTIEYTIVGDGGHGNIKKIVNSSSSGIMFSTSELNALNSMGQSLQTGSNGSITITVYSDETKTLPPNVHLALSTVGSLQKTIVINN